MKKIQVKLFRALLVTSTFPLIVVGCITVVFLGKMAVNDVQQRIDNYLQISQGIYQSVSENLKFVVRDQNRRIYSLLADDQLDLLKNEYAKVIAKNKLDFFVITDNFGKVLVSMSSPGFEGGDYSRDFFVRKALRGQIYVSTEVLDAQELEKLGLLEKARIPGISPDQGLVIKASMPVINNNEIIVGTMTAGYLLNNNNGVIIDKIIKDSNLVASIFLGSARVCSNLPFANNLSVLGTKLNPQAIKSIQENKSDFMGRVQVSNNWYLAGYTPLYNSQKEIIGVLGIGFPEKAIFALRDELMKLFILAVGLSALLALLIGILNGGAVVRSINKLYWGIEAFGRGDYTHRLEIHSQDEIQELAEFFNKTMTQIMSARQELEACSLNVQNLETKVSQGAAQLEAAQKQLVEYERMAAMGRMATALSHELRNIFAEIQASLYNLRTKMAKDCPHFLDYLKGIDDSLNHANDTLSNVLKFSYPKKLIYSEVDVNYLMDSILSYANVQNFIKNNKVKVEKEFAPGLARIKADGMQLREAILNLIINAIQSMPEGGKLAIFTDIVDKAVRIKIVDTGMGMSKEAQANLFTPFFTTKSRGLGLGLCITKAIIQEHSGYIQVFSEIGQGTTFIVSLPFSK
ncbi:MAG: ATP-binding protein [Candidatus Omnitrophica bacterium]|nr:ATP-binding protein [Candidatus Omnitrophota bacterium]